MMYVKNFQSARGNLLKNLKERGGDPIENDDFRNLKWRTQGTMFSNMLKSCGGDPTENDGIQNLKWRSLSHSSQVSTRWLRHDS